MSWTHPESTERKLRTSDALAIQLPSSSLPEAIYMSITCEYDVYYHSDGLFKNHSIKVTVNSKGPKDAEIWDDIIYIRQIFGGE